MGKSSPPSPPDPAKTAQAQGEINADTARLQRDLNTFDVRGPTGSVSYSPVDGDRLIQWTQLSPNQQALFTGQEQIGIKANDIASSQLDRLGGALSQPFNPTLPGVDQSSVNTGALPGLQSSVPNQTVQSGLDFSGLPGLTEGSVAERDSYRDALTARAQPDLDRARSAEMSRLLNSGIREGSQAWDSAMQQFDRQQVDLSNQATLAAGQEQSRIAGLGLANRGQLAGEATTAGTFANQAASQQFGQDVTGANLANQARNQGFNEQSANIALQQQARDKALQEAQTLRNQPLNEIAALASGQQVQQPTPVPTSPVGVAAPNYQGQVNANYDASLQNYYAQQQSRNAALGGLFGLGGSALGSWLA